MIGGPKPLLIVLDLSSSMTESAGSGSAGTKLDAAKRGLINLVNNQASGSQIGLWTYPGAADSCSAGGFVPGADMRQVDDPSKLAAAIQALSADGDTPTADALKESVQSLKFTGYSSATVILVSDGESNCGDDPCATAKQLRSDGYDITVNTMGFQISDSGRKELECIADATQGSYYDAGNGDELNKKLMQTSVPALGVTVKAPAVAQTGGSVELSAQVKNTSAREIPGVTVGLQFRLNGDPLAVQPAVMPPVFDIGTLAPGASQTRRWTVRTTDPGRASHLNWSVVGVGDNTYPVNKAGTINVSDDARGPSGEVLSAIERSKFKAVVLGDSYSSGEGDGDYLPPDADHSDACHRSPHQYAASLLGSPDRVTILACSGAVINDMRHAQNIDGSGRDREVARTSRGQLQMLRDGPPPSAVFLTLGGNDILFSKLATTCLFLKPFCGPGTDLDKQKDGGMTSLVRLSDVYTDAYAIANTAENRRQRGGAIAPVIVLPYPMVLPDTARANCTDLDSDQVRYLNAVETDLNSRVNAEVTEAQQADGGREIYFAEDVAGAFRPDTTMCSATPDVNRVTIARGLGATAADVVVNSADPRYIDSHFTSELAHPNRSGYGREAARLRSWFSSRSRLPSAQPPAPPSDLPPTKKQVDRRIDLGTRVRPGIAAGVNAATTMATEAVKQAGVMAGDLIEVTARLTMQEEATAGGFVVVSSHSAPRTLAVSELGRDGTFTSSFAVPQDLPQGRHTITITAFGGGGQPVQWTLPVVVKEPLPWWFWGLSGVAAAATLGAAVGGWRVWRLR